MSHHGSPRAWNDGGDVNLIIFDDRKIVAGDEAGGETVDHTLTIHQSIPQGYLLEKHDQHP